MATKRLAGFETSQDFSDLCLEAAPFRLGSASLGFWQEPKEKLVLGRLCAVLLESDLRFGGVFPPCYSRTCWFLWTEIPASELVFEPQLSQRPETVQTLQSFERASLDRNSAEALFRTRSP